jgi:hypothetical protein
VQVSPKKKKKKNKIVLTIIREGKFPEPHIVSKYLIYAYNIVEDTVFPEGLLEKKLLAWIVGCYLGEELPS